MSKSAVINALNKLLGNELYAVNQYFLQAKHLQHIGVKKLGDFFRAESIDEMKHAEILMDRIFFLDGKPKVSYNGKLVIEDDIKQLFSMNLVMEENNVEDYRKAIIVADEENDFVTSDIIHNIMQEEESHVGWLRQQISVMNKIGLESYLQTQI